MLLLAVFNFINSFFKFYLAVRYHVLVCALCKITAKLAQFHGQTVHVFARQLSTPKITASTGFKRDMIRFFSRSFKYSRFAFSVNVARRGCGLFRRSNTLHLVRHRVNHIIPNLEAVFRHNETSYVCFCVLLLYSCIFMQKPCACDIMRICRQYFWEWSEVV